MYSKRHIAATLASAVLLAGGLAACGSDDESGKGASTAVATTAASGNDGANAALESSKAELAKFIGQPSPFPVAEPLKELPKNAKIALMVVGTPQAVIQADIMKQAGKAAGVDVVTVKAGPSASMAKSGADAVVAMKPSAVIVLGVSMELWGKQAMELKEMGIPVIAGGLLDVEKYGVTDVLFAEPYAKKAGELVATFVASEYGPKADVVFYTLPELQFTAIEAESFGAHLKKICAECKVRNEKISIAEIGTTAPNKVVSDLQANSDTTVTVYSTGEQQQGVPQALKTAGIDVKSVGFGVNPTILQYLKDGNTNGSLAIDSNVASWQMFDQALRKIVGQEITGSSAEGQTTMQMLRPSDVTFDPSKGFVAYPDYEERFKKLWGVTG